MPNFRSHSISLFALALLCTVSLTCPAAEHAGSEFPRNVYWGDTHLHTRNSADAYSLGNRNLTPADAYRFARGQELTAHNGMTLQLRRPLDFLVVSDHAEYLGGFYRTVVDDVLVKNTRIAGIWRTLLAQNKGIEAMSTFSNSMEDPESFPPLPESSQRQIWRDVAQTADEYNDPGLFTAFSGYEWTSMVDGNNLHRVVIYRDGADKVGQLPPFSAQDSRDPRDLWRALARYEEVTGGQVLAIAHNGNLSNGIMFPSKTLDGKPIDKSYAALRARWEPVYEVTQVKGDGEAHPLLSPTDEFADFENWDMDNIAQTQAKAEWMLAHEYARGALKLGLAYEATLGENPFRFGMIGSTDGHNTFSTVEEDQFFGKFPESEPSAERLGGAMAQGLMWPTWRIVASGYAAVWARENTREAIFAAMQRREVYATTGSRIQVRFFAGWDYPMDTIQRPHYLDIAYGDGVPMGGELRGAPQDTPPRFIVAAQKDPEGANLDRIQIIKGWRARDGSLREKVYDVAWSGEREIDPSTGKLPAVGNTVDVTTATYRNAIGAGSLATVWQDPNFNAGERAFYYARVLEIPTPRWSTYDAVAYKLDLAPEVPRTLQDRAYTSPIWYTP